MTDSYSFDVLVVGSGVIGISTALRLQKNGKKVLIIEKNTFIAEETSARNSGVIHSGIYYPKNSLKKMFCIRGNELIYKFCSKYNVPHKKTGKLIVSNSEDEEKLFSIFKNGKNNGLNCIEIIDRKQIKKIEPNISSKITKAIYVKSSGIVDQPFLCSSMLEKFKEYGGEITCNTNFESYEYKDSNHISLLNTLGEKFYIKSKYLILCPGLHSYEVGKKIEPIKNLPYLKKLNFVKGHYYKLNVKEPPFTRLIYPIPSKLGLGIHYTLDLSGYAKFGPDTHHVDNINYRFNDDLKMKFFTEIVKYYPKIKVDDLVEDYTGIRPKLDLKNKFNDFSILNANDHKIDGLIFLQGFESPGLTSSMAIAEYLSKNFIY